MGVNFTQDQINKSAAGRKLKALFGLGHSTDFAKNLKTKRVWEYSGMEDNYIPVDLADPVVFQVDPIPAFRHTQGQMKLIHIEDHNLDKSGRAIKIRIIRSENYKIQLRILASALKFKLPDCNFKVVFYLPTPRTWSVKRKREAWGKPHQQKPDGDNLMKLFQDALKKKDSSVWDYRVQKFWCPEFKSRIEVSYQP